MSSSDPQVCERHPEKPWPHDDCPGPGMPAHGPRRFQVTRVSVYDARPCAEAIEGTIDRWDRRTFKSPEEHDAKLGAPGKMWADRGDRHEIERDQQGAAVGIRRRLGPEPAWFIEIQSLDELLAFQAKYGDLVLCTSNEDGKTPRIDIYDNFRE